MSFVTIAEWPRHFMRVLPHIGVVTLVLWGLASAFFLTVRRYIDY